MTQDVFDKAGFIAETEKLFHSRDLNHALMESLPYPAMLIRKDRRLVYANKAAIDMGVEVGTFCWDTFGKKASISEEDRECCGKSNGDSPHGIKCTFCKADESLNHQQPVNEKIPAGEITYDTYWIPLVDDVYLHYATIL